MRYWKILTLGMWLCVVALGDEAPVVDPMRPELDRLLKNKKVQEDTYEFPYMMCESARVYPISQGVLVQKLRAHLHTTAVPSGKPFPFPKEIQTGKHKSTLDECNTDYCWVKLNYKHEVTPLLAAKEKLETYKSFVEARVARYQKSRALMGYEHREDNLVPMQEMVAYMKFFPKRYPKTYQFAHSGLWKGTKLPPKSPPPLLRSEVVNLGVEKIEPVFRVGQLYETTENGATIFLDIHIYSNHYFDASLRLIEVIALPKEEETKNERSAVIITDMTEIDELKKSGLIRTLFTGQMVRAVQRFQTDELAALAD